MSSGSLIGPGVGGAKYITNEFLQARNTDILYYCNPHRKFIPKSRPSTNPNISQIDTAGEKKAASRGGGGENELKITSAEKKKR